MAGRSSVSPDTSIRCAAMRCDALRCDALHPAALHEPAKAGEPRVTNPQQPSLSAVSEWSARVSASAATGNVVHSLPLRTSDLYLCEHLEHLHFGSVFDE